MDRLIGKLGRWLVPAIVALALLVRLIQAARYFIKRDSCTYLEIAKALSVGQLTVIQQFDFPPLYPLLVALARPLFDDWVTAGKGVSVLLSALAVIPLYLLACQLVERRTAVLAGLLYAVHPHIVEWHSNVLSEGSFLFFWLWGLYFVCRAIEHLRWRDFALGGMFSALAFLVRPEGLEIVLLLSVFVLCQRGCWGRRTAGLALALVAAMLVAGPYVALLSRVAGKPLLTKKKPVPILNRIRFGPGLRLPDQDPVPHATWSVTAEPLVVQFNREATARGLLGGDRVKSSTETISLNKTEPEPRRPGRWLRKLPSSLNDVLILFLLVGVWGLRRELAGPQRLLLSVFLLHLVLVFYNLYSHRYISSRHLIPPVSLALIWAAVGLESTSAWLAARLEGSRRRWPDWTGTLTLIVCVALAAQTLRPVKGRSYFDQIGQELAGFDAEGVGTIICDDPRVAYYAGAGWNQLDDRGGYRGILQQLVKKQARYVAVKQELTHRLAPFITLGWLKPVELPALATIPLRRRVHVYQVLFYSPIAR